MRRLIVRAQNALAHVFGLGPRDRAGLVRSMLHRPRGDAAGYWLQLLISTALATLGLALDSTAVVIGAMLIAPLMRPLVELAMGLATGSPPLVFRTGVRMVGSVVVVVAASAAFTQLLPLHEVTRELLARTSPTILDLFVAAACALAGAYAVVISSSDVATTAAGTSIGISLVPPLCTAGYGISIGDAEMAKGAGLLFTANVTGIIVFASLVFVLVGFGQVDIRSEERSLDDDADIGRWARLGNRLSGRTSGVRLGVLVRVMLPALLLGAIAVPLERALREMARSSAIRRGVSDLLSHDRDRRIIQYSLDLSARPVVLRVIIVGEPASARTFEHELRDHLAQLGAPRAAVSVWAVSDADAMASIAARLDDVPAMAAPAPPAPPPPPPLVDRLRSAWPVTAGRLLAITTHESGALDITHLGPPLGHTGLDLLAQVAGASNVAIEERALEPTEYTDGNGTLGDWTVKAIDLLERAHDIPELSVCVEVPAPPARRGVRESRDVVEARELLTQVARTRGVPVTQGDRWRVQAQDQACVPDEAEAHPHSQPL